MTQKDRNLLLKDLCARLPYGLYVHHKNFPEANLKLSAVFSDNRIGVKQNEIDLTLTSINECKPYLRPMSSMTEEELNECVYQSGIKDIECPNWQDVPKEKQFEARLNHAIAVFLTDSNNIDWLLAHYFDFRGLIEKGLALEAPEGMYKTE